MLIGITIEDLFNYLLKRESTQFFVSMAIRSLAIGMVGIFEPIYLYIYFNRSISYTLFFWGIYSGVLALGVVLGGKAMEKFGLKRSMLLSSFFYFAYYVCLFFIQSSFWMIPLAILARVIGASLFWPAFHTDFIRFTKGEYRAKGVSSMSIVSLLAGILSPIIGGFILAGLGYASLFVVVLVTLFASSFPLFLSKERYEVYTDTYKGAWSRIKKNKDMSFALGCLGIEAGIDFIIWPIFIISLGVTYEELGGICTFALFVAAFFAWYIGRISTRQSKRSLLNIGSVLLSLACAAEFFIKDAISAFLAQNFYRVSKTTALIPFRTILYDRAAALKDNADEFIVYREIVINSTRAFFFISLGIIFFFVPIPLKYIFFLGALAAFGYSFLAKPRLFSFNKIIKIKHEE
ncbi:hypothetical protein B6D52_02675 [Candidatus Parcubacteria bacterium 4484_255]|nr:MAG: hypothetical protein B6D52_02675 [Candidatus Parcubacteria bacterium 4484_255]